MALTPTKTETMNVTEARRTFSETFDRVRRGETRVIVEKSGIPVGAVVSMADLARIDRDRANRAALLEALAESRKAFGGIPGDEIESEIEKAISEVESERTESQGRGDVADTRE
jgi:prevent-host-death family protein